MSTYRNPWHRPFDATYGPAFYTTEAKPTEHAGHLIYQRIPGQVWDVVRDGVCVTQRAGPAGAMRAAEELCAAGTEVRCSRCGRYEVKGARPCPSGDPKCPTAARSKS